MGSRLWMAGLATLLPCGCVLCGALGRDPLCPPCRAQFCGAATCRCPACAEPLADAAGAQPCGRCLARRPAYDATVAAVSYAMPLDRLVLELKFGGRLAHARLFAGLLADAVRAAPALVAPELLCPVPLAPGRLAERGFNQALEMARPLGRLLNIAVAPRLAQRVQETSAQSRLRGGARQANIAHVFAVPERAAVAGRHIGIVDDVMSSGQTLQELAAVLKRHGATRVTNLVFARTPPHR
ncbi:ComF family protein [Pseudoduganella chitinolytica]|uniref:ComF family protein n=1 Tax=Pseudoduganella chitinolytica TaxID=34070 RepID=A0ABY8B540_9BURK|nr:ComF family protein [Pseudoduganella chitinolytica]WEF30995.1 ComF family protein [Pseudoduganella chitinolytica]